MLKPDRQWRSNSFHDVDIRLHLAVWHLYWKDSVTMLRKVSACRDRTSEGSLLYSKHFVTSQKCPYHVTFDLDHEHTLDAGPCGDHRVQVWWRSSHVCGRSSDLRKKVYRRTDGQTDGRRTPRDCISSFMEWANKNGKYPILKISKLSDKTNSKISDIYPISSIYRLYRRHISCQPCLPSRMFDPAKRVFIIIKHF